jgi:drug/metabolite transporter (DMT)-like permease
VAPSVWGEDEYGDPDLSGNRRRWRRGWHHYAAFMLAMIGVFLVIGAFQAGPRPLTGAVLVLLSPVAVVLADGRKHRPPRPVPAPPTLRVELAWTGVALALVVTGLVLVAV